MRSRWILLKITLLMLIIVGLFGFSNHRNANRNLSKIDIAFVDESSPFITVDAVNKLLIQNQASVTGLGKETLVLKDMEYRLLDNPMVRDAQVFVTIDGRLGAKIEQREPIGRVSASPDYYLDSDGKKMPLSTIYTARVPLITGISSANFKEVAPLLLEINKDPFMKESVIGISKSKQGNCTLHVRKQDFEVYIGQPVALKKKFQNYKAFYKKTQKDSTIFLYKNVNLQFESQVVATKK